ncbi:MAG TPA: nickel-dependent lactate racemase [Spirochaetota bacterium]|nr:nickel-dependent lactate racemase [Spirochaetota bacterium]
MKVSLPWGDTALHLDVPDSWQVMYPQPIGKGDRKKKNELSIVKSSLKKPSDSTPLHKKKLKKKKAVIIVDDNTRPTPAHKFFHLILDELKASGVLLKDIVALPGLGIHTAMTEQQMADKVGAKNLKSITWENHDAFNPDCNHYFGTTQRGTPVYLNKHLADADIIVLVGLIEPHLWAGFGGGLKNILPGVASAETIGRHHEIIAEPPYRFNRVGVKPEENSFRLDLEEIQGMIEADIFCVNVVLDHNNEIIESFTGDPVSCHRAGVQYMNDTMGLEMDVKVDGIITNSYPMDFNFKQSMKCVGNVLPALKPKGTVMGFLRAEHGLDDIPLPEDSKPLWLVKSILRLLGPARVMWFLEKVKKGLNVEEKFLIYYSMQLIREYELYFHVPSLSEEEIEKLGFFVNYTNPQDVIDQAVKKLPINARVAVFPQGGATYPLMGNQVR